MANKKISELTSGGAPQNNDAIPVARSGSNVKVLWSALVAALGLGSLASQNASAVAATGGTFANGVFSVRLNTVAPANNAAVSIDWGYGATKITTQGTNVLSMANVPTGVGVAHLVYTDNFNNVTWPVGVDFGVDGEPSIAGPASVVLKTLDGGATILATVDWQGA